MSCLRSSPILKMSRTGMGEMADWDMFFSSSHIGSCEGEREREKVNV